MRFRLFRLRRAHLATGALLLAGLPAQGLAFNYIPLPEKPHVPEDNPMTKAKTKLGRTLYFDPRLSVDNSRSCQSCHNVFTNGADVTPFSTGVKGRKTKRNTPTIFNAAYHSVYFWDGRAKTLEEQVVQPILTKYEMGMPSNKAVLAKLNSIDGYEPLFKKAFGEKKDPITMDHVAKALATFVRTLKTPDAPFDRYVSGDPKAISAKARAGYRLVKRLGCNICHVGANVAGPNLEPGKGLFVPFPAKPNRFAEPFGFREDKGRYQVTGKRGDKNVWRVPTWRNVARTAPYFHNGAVDSLTKAIRIMAASQLGKGANRRQRERIAAFLKTLNGKRPDVSVPDLPH